MSDQLSRRKIIDLIVGLPVAAAALAVVAAPAEAAKSAQKAVQYVDVAPAGKKPCSACKFYLKAKKSGSKGACSLVAGQISPKGYCIIWAPKA